MVYISKKLSCTASTPMQRLNQLKLALRRSAGRKSTRVYRAMQLRKMSIGREISPETLQTIRSEITTNLEIECAKEKIAIIQEWAGNWFFYEANSQESLRVNQRRKSVERMSITCSIMRSYTIQPSSRHHMES
jgi:hypothetical protein